MSSSNIACTSKTTTLNDWRGKTSASRVYAGNGYEISDDLQRRKIEVLEKRYGGRSKAHRAAIVIQRAYREYRLSKRWQQMRDPVLRVPITAPPVPNLIMGNRLLRTPTSLVVSPHRYNPSTSLSAQLRADRTIRAGTEERARSPPSPSPNIFHNRSMIDSLMSPRLVQRRFPPGSNGEVPVVWVPRASLAAQNQAHSNSLPRLEKQIVRDTIRLPRAMTEQERKRQYRIALNFFNKKPERGVQLLTSWGFVEESPEALAKLLFGRRGLSKQMIGEYVGTLHTPFHNCVLKYFIGLMDLRGLEVDVALRKALQYFILPKESEKIDKVLQAFAIHYCKCNPNRASMWRGGWDSVHMLAFAIMMLNTDLHSPNLKNSVRMRSEEFVRNLRGQDKSPGEKEGRDFDRSFLEGIYDRIRQDEFVAGDDHVAQVRRVEMAIIGKDKPRLTETQRRLVCYCRLQQVMDPCRKQPPSSHERDVFLFNDMLVVTKAISKRKSSAATTYALKHHSPLLGASVHEFSKGQYEFGLVVVCPNHEKLYFNARNVEDRRRFVADVVESIKESTQMEEVRLELELDKLRIDSQRDSGLPDIEGQAPTRRLSFNSLDSGVVEETYDAT
ncbi:unnamed protein product [Auanema sp. JU1783]|nr:unnamed protein product [Auanema sp. JU1783]